ncbi:hypothetical protein BCR43DRAFT_507115 [Syncephalastrum racemosum]|uniref:Uncharacterized protein n=1 Tax=Syncephalastrum racemosum TaxID=13706 RepID=A0A1X2H5W5_SYNRA|nr:hypothetical protein BCR43DRAFT_507115 [Syncephalastrum racemosum]
MYSKSQQILLGLPQPQPVVFLSGDDMMYTPPLVQPQQHYPPNDVDDYEHENHPDYYYDDDDHWHDEYKADQLLTEDEGVLVMTAPSPEEPRRVLDETMWMSRKDEFKEDEMEEEERNEEAMAPVGIPPDLVDWYRAGNNQRRPPTIMDSSEPAVHGETTQAEKQDEKQDDGMADASATSYQSLADIMPTTKTTRSAPGVTQALSYGSTTMQAKTKILTWPDMITTTLLRLADWADDMPLENAWDAIVCVVRIWYMLFVCAELMLHHAYSGRRLEQPAEEDRRWLDHMV